MTNTQAKLIATTVMAVLVIFIQPVAKLELNNIIKVAYYITTVTFVGAVFKHYYNDITRPIKIKE